MTTTTTTAAPTLVCAETRLEPARDGLPSCFVVRAIFDGVNRREGRGIALSAEKASGAKLAKRLHQAIEAGVVFTNLRTLTDQGGRTYAGYDTAVMGRYLNSDLRKLGF